jgi:hypothetical protein
MNNLAVKESKKAKNMDLVLFLNNDVDLEQGLYMKWLLGHIKQK